MSARPTRLGPLLDQDGVWRGVTLKPIRHYSVIHDAPGFTAASVRAIVSAAYLLARPAFPHAVHSSVREAARWAAKQNELIGRRDDAPNIEAIIQALRGLHRERYPGHER